ncbi:MAG TPA: hypothetical protein VF176_01740 [Solirubrobacterales bacterium]
MKGHVGLEEIELLPLVKAYPNLSRQYGEISCVAGLRLSGVDLPEWIRLYPVPFRTLDRGDQQFRKYQPIRVKVGAPKNDRRPESRRADADSIEIAGQRIGTEEGWRSRRSIVEPAISKSMCAIQQEQRDSGTSLGMFRVAEFFDLLIEEVEPDPEKSNMADAWAAQRSLLQADELEVEREALEQIPYRFKYRYRCSATGCRTHTQSIVDWEIAQLFRQVRERPDWRELIRAKWLKEMCGANKDTALIVGNQHQYPNSFLVLGVWWPPKQPEQLSLADVSDV